MTDQTFDSPKIIERTTEIVADYVGNNVISVDDLARLIADVHAVLLAGASPSANVVAIEREKPTVFIGRFIHHDHIVCMDCGGSFKSLKRHLVGDHFVSSDEYRAKWKLPMNYPMVAPAYAEARSRLAKAIALGQRRTFFNRHARPWLTSRIFFGIEV